jgi:XRE family transcriptional regulator of biofilm formation
MPERVSHKHLGSRVRELREEKGWSLTELSQRADISRSYLSQIEQGESMPTQSKIIQLANALGALPSELLGEEPDKEIVSPSLRAFAEELNLGSAEVQMLARIEYRGKKPSSVEEWRAIYSVIKGMLGEIGG